MRWPRREVIGDPQCPILMRWTLLGDSGRLPLKLMIHHFLPDADDRHVHDHPRPFWTLVLRGRYEDWVKCAWCGGVGWVAKNASTAAECAVCDGDGVTLGDRMRPGTLRFRPARHAHRTKVGPEGCWTIVLMGPLRRPWGFWIRGHWWSLRDYEKEYGFGMRCGDDG